MTKILRVGIKRRGVFNHDVSVKLILLVFYVYFLIKWQVRKGSQKQKSCIIQKYTILQHL